jgi:ribonucleoside-diphosphate reductase beta chain
MTGTLETDKALLKNLIAYYCVLEGIFFYCGFTQICRWVAATR